MKNSQEHQLKAQNACEDGRTGDTIAVQTYDSFETLSNLQQDWDSFMEEMNAEIFLTYDWCSIWWKYYGKGRELKVFIFKQKNKIIGILPLFRETFGLWPIYLNVIKIVGTDFMPITINVPLKKEYLGDIIHCLLSNLSQICSWDIIYLGVLCGKCELVVDLEKAFKENLSASYNIAIKTTNVQTYIKIANNLDTQLAAFNKTKKKEMRHFYKQLSENIVSFDSCYANENNFESFFSAFVCMHQIKWRNDGQAGHFVDWPESYNFHHEVALKQIKHNRLRLLQIKINGEDAGYQYSYKFGNAYYMYLNARQEMTQFGKINVGLVMLCEDAKQAMIENIRFLDLMRGRYDYKLQAGGYLLPVNNLYIYSTQSFKLIRITFFQSFFKLLDILYFKIWRRRVVPKLRMRPKPLLNIWIKTNMLSR